MNANAELDALLGWHAGVALDHSALDFDRAAHGVDHAAELDDRAVAGALDDASVVDGDDRVDQVAAQRPRSRASVRSSSAFRLAGYSRRRRTTRIAASFRVSLMARPSAAAQFSTRRRPSHPLHLSRGRPSSVRGDARRPQTTSSACGQAKSRRPGLPDEIVAERVVGRFADEAEPRRLIDAARGDQHVVGP